MQSHGRHWLEWLLNVQGLNPCSLTLSFWYLMVQRTDQPEPVTVSLLRTRNTQDLGINHLNTEWLLFVCLFVLEWWWEWNGVLLWCGHEHYKLKKLGQSQGDPTCPNINTVEPSPQILLLTRGISYSALLNVCLFSPSVIFCFQWFEFYFVYMFAVVFLSPSAIVQFYSMFWDSHFASYDWCHGHLVGLKISLGITSSSSQAGDLRTPAACGWYPETYGFFSHTSWTHDHHPLPSSGKLLKVILLASCWVLVWSVRQSPQQDTKVTLSCNLMKSLL